MKVEYRDRERAGPAINEATRRTASAGRTECLTVAPDWAGYAGAYDKRGCASSLGLTLTLENPDNLATTLAIDRKRLTT